MVIQTIMLQSPWKQVTRGRRIRSYLLIRMGLGRDSQPRAQGSPDQAARANRPNPQARPPFRHLPVTVVDRDISLRCAVDP